MPESIPEEKPVTNIEKLVAFAAIAFDGAVTLEPALKPADAELNTPLTQSS